MSTDEARYLNLSQMVEIVDLDLRNELGKICNEAEKNATEVEMTIAAFLGEAIGMSCDSEEEIEINIEAYLMLIRSVAHATLLEEKRNLELN